MLSSDPFSDLTPGLNTASGDLSNWDFLQDLDFGVDLDFDNNALSQAERSQPTSKERIKEQNRKAQQRARQRKKVCKLRVRGQSCNF